MAALIDRNRVLKLLGTGLGADAVATAIGCDASYISQLMSEEEFKQQVIELRTVNLTAASERDRKVDTLEERVLDRLEEMLGWISKPREMLQAYQVLNAAKRRGTSAPESLVINQQIVNLNLPAVAFQKLLLDGRGEVVEVGGRSMITIQPAQLTKELIAQKGGSDAAEKTLKALRNREIATPGYEKRTGSDGNRASVYENDGREAFDI